MIHRLHKILQIAGFIAAAMVILPGCNVGGADAFIPGDSVEDNNARAAGEPVTGDWVIMNLLDEPEHLNPQTSTSASATYIKNYIYESLIQTRREPPWDEEPLLSDGMPEVSPDHLVYRWRLRPEARWHDGQPLTARDVEFTLKSLTNPYVDNLPSKPYYAELESLIVEGDHTITMFCTKPYFMHLQFLGGNFVMPRHIWDPNDLLGSLTFAQVKYGTGYGRLADLLESERTFPAANLVAETILHSLMKSVEQVTGGKVKADAVEAAIAGTSRGAEDRLAAVINNLSGNPDAAPAVRLITEGRILIERALDALPGEQRLLAGRDQMAFAALCRDLHTRIETYGRACNSHEQNRMPTVGSGPFRFAHWKTGQELVLERNADYWDGPGHAYLDRIVFRVLTDYTASLVALKNGTIDFMENLQTIQFLTLTNQQRFLDRFIKSTFLIPTYSYLGWRNSNPIFSDLRVRNAMTRLVRRREIAQQIQFGFSEVVESPFYRFGSDFDTTLGEIPFDPVEASRILREAGWEDIDRDGILEKDSLEFRFEMLIPSGIPLAEQTVSILREDLATVGIAMEIRRLEWSVFINNYIRNKKFDATYLAWAMGLRQDPKQIWHSSSAVGRGSNFIEFKNELTDSLIEVARVEFDPERRAELYRQFQQILYREQPYTFMYSTKFKPAYDKRFKGVKWYPFRPGYQLDEWWVPKEEQRYL